MVNTTKSSIMSSLADIDDFHKIGSSILTTRNEDIFAGLIIEVSRSLCSVSTFILPMYEQHKEIHLTLGDRLVSFQLGNVIDKDLLDKVAQSWNNLSKVTSAIELKEYALLRKPCLPYCEWVGFASSVRLGLKSETVAGLERVESLEAFLAPSVAKSSFALLRTVFKNSGFEAAQALLQSWSHDNQLKWSLA